MTQQENILDSELSQMLPFFSKIDDYDMKFLLSLAKDIFS